jgi:hypothetical protein
MANWQGNVFSIFATVGLIVAADLRPIIDLIHDYAPQSIIVVPGRMENGDEPGSLFIMAGHPNQTSLNSTSELIRASREWVNALAALEFAGHSVR